jgi:hypothetical protein
MSDVRIPTARGDLPAYLLPAEELMRDETAAE